MLINRGKVLAEPDPWEVAATAGGPWEIYCVIHPWISVGSDLNLSIAYLTNWNQSRVSGRCDELLPVLILEVKAF